MAEISEIAGIGTTALAKRNAPDSNTAQGQMEEMRQRAALVTKPVPIDTAILSDGEMAVELMRQRYQMLAQYFPETKGYRKAEEMAYNALHKGLHTANGVGAWTKVLDPEQNEVAWTIINARSRTAPASGYFSWDEKTRTPADGGIHGIGEIPQLDCYKLHPYINPADHPGQTWVDVANQNNAAAREKCRIENLWRGALNNWWPDTGTVLIYEFLTNEMIPSNLPQELTFALGRKSGRHLEFVGMVQYGSKISRSNLRTWLTNGCIQKSISGAQGGTLGPATPEDWIAAYREGGEVGFPFALIPIAIAVSAIGFTGFKRLIQVIKGDMSMKQAIQAQVGDIQAFFEKYGSQLETLGSKEDFRIPKPGDDTTPPVNCEPGWHWDYTEGKCVKDKEDDGGGGFNLGKNGLLVGAGLVGAALLLGGKE